MPNPVKKSSPVLERLSHSPFRSRFHLSKKELQYLRDTGLETIGQHAREFIERRLAPAQPPNDGKQTPMRNHPVFVAQHATATCCRRCLERWHGIPRGVELSAGQINYVMTVILDWLQRQNEMDTLTPP